MATILPDACDNEGAGFLVTGLRYASVMAVMDVRVHRLTVEDYLRLVADGDDGRWDRTELVEGVIYDVSPESLLHGRTTVALLHALQAAKSGHEVLNAGSVRLSSESIWDPDVFLLRPGADPQAGYADPADVELVVEVAVTTLGHDLGPKYRGYARAAVPEYWVVVPGPEGYLLRHRSLGGDGYAEVTRFELTADVATLVADALG